MWDFGKLINIDDTYSRFIGVRIGSFRLHADGKKYIPYLGHNDRKFVDTCFGGNMYLVKAMIEQRIKTKKYIINFLRNGFISACASGNIVCAKYLNDFMHRKVNVVSAKDKDTYFGCFMDACQYGFLDVIKFILQLTQFEQSDLNQGVMSACFREQIDTVSWLVKNVPIDRERVLHAACLCGNIKLVLLAIDNDVRTLNRGLDISCRLFHKDIIKLLIKRGANECSNCHKSMQEHLKLV
jgi:hypothetical protein